MTNCIEQNLQRLRESNWNRFHSAGTMSVVRQDSWHTQVETEIEKYMKPPLPFWDVIVIFTENKVLLKKGAEILQSVDCRKLWSLFGDKKEAITSGVVLDGTQYEVHRWYGDLDIPLIYGREAEDLKGKGFALAKSKGLAALILYSIPVVSAYAVPALKELVQKISQL